MIARSKPGCLARRGVLRLALGGGGVLLIAARPAQAEEAVEVKIDNFAFSPNLVRLKKGTNVTWTNHDDIPHSIVLQALQVRSHPMDTDGSFSYRFEKPGVFNYICGLHPHMKGQVVVA
jgi:plastocyanin